MVNSDIVIYTDGGCSGNPGPGGWGIGDVVVIGERRGGSIPSSRGGVV